MDNVVANDSNLLSLVPNLIGTSNYILELKKEILRIADTNIPVMIIGESGSGKETIALAIHNCSKRKERKMITLNCASIPKNVEESEFFGYSGTIGQAQIKNQGALELADKSTLFIDDIDEISLKTQSLLLGYLDSHEYIQPGSNKIIKTDVRIICATNHDLEELVNKEKFRQDLFFRLKGVIIKTLPLIDHKEDIIPLVKHFLKEQKDPKVPKYVTKGAEEALLEYNWPGNIRELKYTVEVIGMASIGMKGIEEKVVRDVLKMNVSMPKRPQTYKEAKAAVIRDFETRYFIKLLNQFKGNVNKASKVAGMYRPNLLKKLKSLNISPNAFRTKKR
jgi:DNA-binding NtrC family response regulator